MLDSKNGKKKNKSTRLIEHALREEFPSVEAYQYNPASIRVRIVDKRFNGLNNVERDDLVDPLLKPLPEEVQGDITILLLLAPDEVTRSPMNVEF